MSRVRIPRDETSYFDFVTFQMVAEGQELGVKTHEKVGEDFLQGPFTIKLFATTDNYKRGLGT